ncbi:oxidation resistance protein 1 [Ceratobasidium sp. UAMH 11750]|nr:oxidation resistance protein 1 [Ceratobasidium sp. UAMH 11750]
MSWPIGTIQPLLPVPNNTPQPSATTNESSSNSTSLLDLISSSPLESTSTPLFPARKPAPSPAPIRPPRTPPPSHNDLATSPGFGDFISVPPSLDPLALSEALASPTLEHAFDTDFVQGAKARTAEKGRQVMDEFRQSESEKDPLGLLPERERDPTPPDTEPVLPLEATEPIAIRPSSELKRVESEPSIGSRDDSLQASPPPSAPSASSPSFGLGGRLTLPRAWASLLGSSLPSLSPTMTTSKLDATPPTHPTELPPHPKPVRDSSITHGNPFSHTFVPPSGAPGYTGEKWDKGFAFEEDKTGSKASRLKLVGRTEMTTPILTVEAAEMLRPSLPALRRLTQNWTLLYSLDQHGISLATFYARCAQPVTGGCLVVIRDAEGATFGVWCGDGVRKHEGYTGSGESFLWSQQQDGAPVKVFKWTGKNDYVRLCESDFISFGGGNGRFGLYLDSALLSGESASCPTFDNEILCSRPEGTPASGTVKFECVGIEAWGIV